MSSPDADEIPTLINYFSLTEQNYNENSPTTMSSDTNLLDTRDTTDHNAYSSSLMTNTDPMMNNAESNNIDIYAWTNKPVEEWMKMDVLYWGIAESEKANLPMFNAYMPSLCTLTGKDLVSMTLEDFMNRMTNDFFATRLYNSLQRILNRGSSDNIVNEVLTTLRSYPLNDSYYQYNGFDDMNTFSVNSDDYTIKSDDSGVESCSDSEQCIESLQQGYPDEYSLYNNNLTSKNLTDLNTFSNYNSNHEWPQWSSQSNYSEQEQLTDNGLSNTSESDRLSVTTDDEPKEEQPQVPVKKRPGRPRGIRKKKPEKIGLLWEFLRDLLHDPKYNPSVICWDDYKIGKFRFVHSEKVAKMWGLKRENAQMTFDKFSRAMRYHYRSNTLIAVQKRLVYQFGDKAVGWRTPSPILG